jgi:hypothetical protein
MRTIKVYDTYNFRDKDPIFDRIWAIMDGHGLSLKQVADASGMSYQTLRNWRYGKARQAYFSSVVRVVIGLRKWDFKLIDEKIARNKLKVVGGRDKQQKVLAKTA